MPGTMMTRGVAAAIDVARAVLRCAEIALQIVAVLAAYEQLFDFAVAPRQAVVGRDVMRQNVRLGQVLLLNGVRGGCAHAAP